MAWTTKHITPFSWYPDWVRVDFRVQVHAFLAREHYPVLNDMEYGSIHVLAGMEGDG